MTEPSARRGRRAFLTIPALVALVAVAVAVLTTGGSDHARSTTPVPKATADVIQPAVARGPDRAAVTISTESG
jgi:hypothetical protein